MAAPFLIRPPPCRRNGVSQSMKRSPFRLQVLLLDEIAYKRPNCLSDECVAGRIGMAVARYLVGGAMAQHNGQNVWRGVERGDSLRGQHVCQPRVSSPSVINH